MTATELAWISQLVDVLDRAWEAYQSEYPSISNLWHRLAPTRSPTERRDADQAQVAADRTEAPALPHDEAAAESMRENRGELSPRAALAAARAALAAAEVEVEAIDWGRHKVRVRPDSSDKRVVGAKTRLLGVACCQLVAASAAVALAVGTAGAVAHYRGVGPKWSGVGPKWSALWPGMFAAAGSVTSLLPGGTQRGLE